MAINEVDKNRILELINIINDAIKQRENKCIYLEMPYLKEIKDLIFNAELETSEDYDFAKNTVRFLAENYSKSIRIPLAVECYNYLVKIQIANTKIKKYNFNERDQIAWDIYYAFAIRNKYVYDDCEDLVSLVSEYFPHEHVVFCLEEAKNKWQEDVKRDSIERTERFLNVIDSVEERVYETLKTRPNANKLKLYKRELKRHGIDWKTPAELNDGVLFD